MTNRDYLRGLNNKKNSRTYAELIWYGGNDKICNDMAYGCYSRSCTECIKKRLDTERESNIEEGQIRQNDLKVYYLIFMVTDTECLIIGDRGGIYKRPKSIVETWAIRNDISIDEFIEKIFNNL